MKSSSAIPGPKGGRKFARASSVCSPTGISSTQHCGESAPRGLKVLYEDPDLGFQILAHINDKARASPPHDHGASWAIYGQATHYTDMIEWEREDDASRSRARQAQAGQEVSPAARTCRHLSGRHDSFDRLSRPRTFHPRHRHQPRQYRSRALRSGTGDGAPDDAAAGDVAG